MKRCRKTPETPDGTSSSKRGVALLMTLTITALVTILVLSIFALGQNELNASTHYRRGVEVEGFSQTAVNLAIAQIRAATNQPDLAWASQPGAIRTYNRYGEFTQGYKLYSSSQMRVTLESTLTHDQPPDDWDTVDLGTQWVDLNEPLIRGNAVHYPIVDPRAMDELGVEGFGYDLEDVGQGPSKIGLPMPVQWIYQLRDGTLGYANRFNHFMPFEKEGRKPDKGNPIVARLAFWTDDECGKININTASEPTFWDTPRAGSRADKELVLDDRAYGLFQPVQGEYQRYPGHPATTALSPVLLPGREDIAPQDKEKLYRLTPRVGPGGSEAGTYSVLTSKPVHPDHARLYPSVDEFIMTPRRAENPFPELNEGESPETYLARTRFFLTAHSRAPELNLFNMPRVSIWPTHLERETPAGVHWTPYDEMARLCATLGTPEVNEAYYHFQRKNSDHPTEDWETIPRNRELYAYLQQLSAKEVPGFGGRFYDKYGEDQDQILTEIVDYIRSTNLYDENLEPSQYTGKEWLDELKQSQYTDPRNHGSATGTRPGHGQVAPLYNEENETRGFGRFYTITEVGILLICNADAGPPNPEDPSRPLYPKGVAGSNVPQHRALAKPLDFRTRQKSIQAMLLFELFSPSLGWTQLHDDISLEVELVRDFGADGQTLRFNSGHDRLQSMPAAAGAAAGNSGWGGTTGFWGLLRGRRSPPSGPVPEDRYPSLNRGDNRSNNESYGYEGNKKTSTEDHRAAYPFISAPVVIDGMDETMSLTGGKLRIQVYSGHDHTPKIKNSIRKPQLVQTLEVDFPDTTLPVPRLITKPQIRGREPDLEGPEDQDPRPATGVLHPGYWWVLNYDGPGFERESDGKNFVHAGKITDKEGNFLGWRKRLVHRGRLYNAQTPNWLFRPEDVVRSMVTKQADYRLIAGRREISSDEFQPHRDYDSAGVRLAHNFAGANTVAAPGYDLPDPKTESEEQLVPEVTYWPARQPDFPFGSPRCETGDFDNGISIATDGAYINKPDEGNVLRRFNSETGNWTGIPYYKNAFNQAALPAYFSPNRQVPSAVMFGSLPTGIKRQIPWQTLLFRPQKGHPNDAKPEDGAFRGRSIPPDHLLLDWFWMPVVEPYAISEPFSTGGKINMNYQIVPFTHIRRSTGIRAVLKEEKLLIIPRDQAPFYKKAEGQHVKEPLRHSLDVGETLRQFEARFAANRLFKSASEICDLHLVPEDSRLEDMDEDFWAENALTGDNTRERPYANIYPRLTTKSNVFRVHYRVQLLQLPPAHRADLLDPEWLVLQAEYRGSTLIERYLDPAEPLAPDYAVKPEASDKLDRFYKFRIINKRRFSP